MCARRVGYDGNIDPDNSLGSPTKFILADGTIKFELSNGCLHREKAPAKISPDGLVEYFYNGVLHRDDGPAVDYIGKKEDYPDFVPQYWLNGMRCGSIESFKARGGKINTQEELVKKNSWHVKP